MIAANVQAASPASATGSIAVRPALPAHDARPPDLGAYVAWIVVLVVALFVVLALRRRRTGSWGLLRPLAGRQEDTVRVTAVRGIAPGTSLQVVEWGDRELLIACTAQAVTLLDSRPRRKLDDETP